MNASTKVRVRFAPSPTGYLHVGGLRTALYNYLFARHNGGTFVLRIEDTDRSRFVEGATEKLIDTLKWADLDYDEGPQKGGPFGSYIQSERLEIYHTHVDKLLRENKAYRCFCSMERLESMRKEQERQNLSPKYDRLCLRLSPQALKENMDSSIPFVIRMKVPDNEIIRFHDVIREEVEFQSDRIDDQVLLKSDGYPTYHLANVVDDHQMQITHVIRGEEWLSSTPKHVLLYQYFGWERPTFAHLPLLLNADRSKLSKRQGDVAVEEYRAKGYLREALINFVALLGWNPGDDREVFKLEELVKEFSLDRVGKAGAIFNVEKLNWMNFEHLRRKSDQEMLSMLRAALTGSRFNGKHFTDDYILQVIVAMRERVSFVNDFLDKSPYFFEAPSEYEQESVKKRWTMDSPNEMRKLADEFSKLTGPTPADYESALHQTAESLGVSNAKLIHPLRLAVSGVGGGPGVYEILSILGKDESIKRIHEAINRIGRIESSGHDITADSRAPITNVVDKTMEMGKASEIRAQAAEPPKPGNFIREIIDEDLRVNKNDGKVHTRFPPEPNGYLHIGHAKSIHLNFGIARDYSGLCNVRFDDTNPTKEEVEYVEAIKEDVRWLGFDWDDREYYASDYFSRLYEFAIQLIKKGKAFVCDLTANQIREYRGTLTEPGKESPFRDRSIDANLDLFERMRRGEFPDGTRTLRAKVDMASPNLNMRDPVMYRILHATHHRTGDGWCIYPTYDWAHGQSDSIEGITHSICTLEFEDHRPLYDWFIEQLGIHHSQQIEFARLNLTYTMMSKRKLLQLVEEGIVNGWNDPRMPTITGLRRRGYTPAAIRLFAERIGVSKRETVIDVTLLEDSLREDLNRSAPRVMAVLRPLKVVIDNYPDGQGEELDAVNNPEDPGMGSRKIPFSKVLYIEQDDFREVPPPKYFRLSPGKEVRLRYAYIIQCNAVVRDAASGEVTELHCTYDPDTKSGGPQSQRKVKGTIHWVSAAHALEAEVRVYDRLFNVEDPGGDGWKSFINSRSLEVVKNCKVERSLASVKPQDRFQFERLGYFCADLDSTKEHLVFNRTVTLRDTWAKIEKVGA